MMNKRASFLRAVFVGIVLLVPRFGFGELPLVNTSHLGAINAMAWADQGKILSVGDDGLLRLWDPVKRVLLARWFLSEGPLLQMTTPPHRKEVALLAAKKGLDGFSLKIWDIKKEVFVLERDLSSSPTFLTYSERGNLLIYATDTTLFLIARAGERLGKSSVAITLPTPASYAYVGSAETTLMTYHPEGRIRYWDIAQREMRIEIETIPYLTQVEVLGGDYKRNLVGREKENVYLIDRLLGEPLHRLHREGLSFIGLGKKEAILYTVSRGASHTATALWELNPPGIQLLQENPPLPSSHPITALLGKGRHFYLGNEGGRIERFRPSQWDLVADNTVVPLEELALPGVGYLALMAHDRLLLLTSRFFQEVDPSLSLLEDLHVRIFSKKNAPLSEGLRSFEGKLIVLNKSHARSSAFYLWDPKTAKLDPRRPSLRGPVSEVIPLKDGKIALWKENGLFVLDDRFQQRAHLALDRIQSVLPLNEKTLLVGRRSPKENLLLWTIGKAEFSPFSVQALSVSGMTPASQEGSFYSLDLLTSRAEGAKTTLRLRSLKPEGGIMNGRLIRRASGEDLLDAQLLWDTARSRLYFTVGTPGILRWDGKKLLLLAGKETVKRIAYHRGILYAINRDGSLTLRTPQSDRKMATFYFFKDKSWVITQPRGKKRIYRLSQEARPHLSISAVSKD